jgi:hypothetical protein
MLQRLEAGALDIFVLIFEWIYLLKRRVVFTY